MSRHNDLAVRKPESSSLSRATSYKKTNVYTFFEKLSTVSPKCNFPPYMIFNADETGCSSVTNLPEIIAKRGSKQIGQVSSAEQRTLVTTQFLNNAGGGFLPPIFVFPLKHFVIHDSPSKENPALQLMDKHSSHVRLRVIEFTRQNFVIVAFPLHCSHKLQPLNVTVYGPTKYRIAMHE